MEDKYRNFSEYTDCLFFFDEIWENPSKYEKKEAVKYLRNYLNDLCSAVEKDFVQKQRTGIFKSIKEKLDNVMIEIQDDIMIDYLENVDREEEKEIENEVIDRMLKI